MVPQRTPVAVILGEASKANEVARARLRSRRSKPKSSVVLILICIETLWGQASSLIAIKCGRFFDGKTLALQENVVVLVQDG